MTAETPIDNSEETFVPEDNSEEIDPEVDDVGEHEGQSSSHPSDDTDDTFWSGNPEELPEGLKPVYKNMQGAFTKRMQRVADLERKYLDSIDAANAVVLSRGQAPEPVAKQEEAPEPPDLSKGAKPEDVIAYYVEQEVQKAIKSSGIGTLAEEMQPVAHRERIVGAYRQFSSENPDRDHQQLAPKAGRVIDANPELTELASTNPAAAIRLASKIAQAELRVATTKKMSQKKRQAAPVSARKGTVVKRRQESMLDAATRALKEAGLNPDGF